MKIKEQKNHPTHSGGVEQRPMKSWEAKAWEDWTKTNKALTKTIGTPIIRTGKSIKKNFFNFLIAIVIIYLVLIAKSDLPAGYLVAISILGSWGFFAVMNTFAGSPELEKIKEDLIEIKQKVDNLNNS